VTARVSWRAAFAGEAVGRAGATTEKRTRGVMATAGGVGVSVGSLLFLMRPDAPQTVKEIGDYRVRLVVGLTP
jgi:hypothetical protein